MRQEGIWLDKNSILNFLRKDNKKLQKDMLTVLTMGVLLIVIGNTFFNGKQGIKNIDIPISDINQSPTDSAGEMEKRLEKIFSSVQGAGEVKVMVTFKSGNEVIVAKEEKKKESSETIDIETKVVLLSQGSSNQNPLILKENYPEIEGIVIVAEGGDDVFVKESLNRGAQALLNVPAHKVEVFKMK